MDAANTKMTQQEYDDLLAYNRRVCGTDGIEKAMRENEVDVILGPADSQLYTIAAAAGSLYHLPSSSLVHN